MRTRFVFSFNNEAIIKVLFKIEDDDIAFTRAIEVTVKIGATPKVVKKSMGTANT